MNDSALNFGSLPPDLSSWERSKAVIIPAPFEKSTTYGRGTIEGPRAIIEASMNMELYDMRLGLEPCEAGIHTLPYPDKSETKTTDSMLRYLRHATERVVNAGKLPVVLGGEHTVTLGSLEFLSEKHPELTVLSLDAHTDLREEYEGNRFSHACVMRRALEMCRVVEVGVRSTAREEQPIIKERSVPIFTAEEAFEEESLVEKLPSHLSDDVYVSIDLDVFDPGIMPSTGTPEPGGLGWYDVLRILRIASEKNVVGFDVVELSPKPENKGPDFLAARLIYKFLGYVLFNPH